MPLGVLCLSPLRRVLLIITGQLPYCQTEGLGGHSGGAWLQTGALPIVLRGKEQVTLRFRASGSAFYMVVKQGGFNFFFFYFF